ncbi:hypothetical protein JCM8547_002985 [Rhodosporidiobolus lusitaniae]
MAGPALAPLLPFHPPRQPIHPLHLAYRSQADAGMAAERDQYDLNTIAEDSQEEEEEDAEGDSLVALSCAAPLPPARPPSTLPYPSTSSSVRPPAGLTPACLPAPPSSFPSPPDSSSSSSASPSVLPAQQTSPSPNSAHRAAFDEARALYLSGQSISASNPYAAVLHFRHAATVFREIPGQRKRVEKSLWMAGMCYARVGVGRAKKGEREGAGEAFEEARALFQFVGETSKEAMALYQLGLVTKDVLAAAEYIKRAAALYADLGDEPHEAMCYAEAAHLFGPTDPDTAIFFLKQCLLLYMKLGDSAKEAKALFAIANLAAHLDKRTAHNYYLQARVIFRHRGDNENDANCSYQLGKIAVFSKAYETAVAYFEESCTLFHNSGKTVDEAWSMYRLALVMLKVKTPELAVDYLADARKLFEEAGNEQQAEGSCLMRMGEILEPTNPVFAKTFFEEALELVDPKKERIGRRSTMRLKKLEDRQSQSLSAVGAGGRKGRRSVKDKGKERDGVEEGQPGGVLEGVPEEREEEEREEEEEERARRAEGGEGAWIT